MCFSLQRRAIFRHLNFKKCSETLNFLAFWLQNALLATAACNFWFLLWPHDSAPAALTSLLFDSPDARIIGKKQHFATSLTFGAGESSFFWLSRYCSFFLLTLLHLLTLLSCDFTSSICFSTLHIVGSYSKLPSINLNFCLIYCIHHINYDWLLHLQVPCPSKKIIVSSLFLKKRQQPGSRTRHREVPRRRSWRKFSENWQRQDLPAVHDGKPWDA